MGQQGKYGPEDEVQPNATPDSTSGTDDHPGGLSRFGSAAMNATGVPGLYHAFTDPATAEEQSSPFDTVRDSSIGRGLSRITGGISHALKNAGRDYMQAVDQDSPMKAAAVLSSAALGGIPQTMAKQVNDKDYAGAAGTMAGFGGAMAAPEAATSLLRKVGPAAMRAGAGAVNHAIEATPKMMKYGANPGRGMIEEGVTPNLTKYGMQGKLDTAIPEAGERVGNAVHSAESSVPLPDIARSIRGPVSEARGVIQGPGGGGRSMAPIDALHESMMARAPGASRPIYGPEAGTPFTPEEAVQAMARPVRALPAPQEELPLHSSPDVPGKLSKPKILESGRAMQRDFPPYGTKPHDPRFPGSGVQAYGGMGPSEYIGGAPGERGGLGQPQGVLQRVPTFGESETPSPFSDLRHPNATAPDVWQTVRNIDKNTRFNPDPEIEGVNEVRRDMRSGLRGNLEKAVPDLAPLSQRYSDLVTADEALSRTAGRGGALKSFKDALTFPTEIAGGHALYKFGKGASAAKLNPFTWAPIAANQRSQ